MHLVLENGDPVTNGFLSFRIQDGEEQLGARII
jgi:hypothetical protein